MSNMHSQFIVPESLQSRLQAALVRARMRRAAAGNTVGPLKDASGPPAHFRHARGHSPQPGDSPARPGCCATLAACCFSVPVVVPLDPHLVMVSPARDTPHVPPLAPQACASSRSPATPRDRDPSRPRDSGSGEEGGGVWKGDSRDRDRDRDPSPGGNPGPAGQQQEGGPGSADSDPLPVSRASSVRGSARDRPKLRVVVVGAHSVPDEAAASSTATAAAAAAATPTPAVGTARAVGGVSFATGSGPPTAPASASSRQPRVPASTRRAPPRSSRTPLAPLTYQVAVRDPDGGGWSDDARYFFRDDVGPEAESGPDWATLWAWNDPGAGAGGGVGPDASGFGAGFGGNAVGEPLGWVPEEEAAGEEWQPSQQLDDGGWADQWQQQWDDGDGVTEGGSDSMSPGAVWPSPPRM
jgi:hypothetical protein